MGFSEFVAAAGAASLKLSAVQFPGGAYVAKNPKLATATAVTLVGGYLFYYFTYQEYPAPWLDRRELSSGLSVKDLIENEFEAVKVEGEQWDAIIIGSGGCGLTTGNLLARSGLKVLILEKHYVAGGCTHTWKKDGREFDTGVHYTGNSSKSTSHTTGAMFNFLTDGKLKWDTLDDNYDTVLLNAEDQQQYRFHFVKDNTKQSLLDEFPNEAAGIEKVFDDLARFRKSGMYLGLYKVLPLWFLKPLIALGLHNKLFDNYMFTTSVADYLETVTSNKKLRCILNYSFGDYGTQPRKAPLFIGLALLDHFRQGGVFPIGGSSKMTTTLADPIVARGGKLLVRANVVEINESNGTVTGVTVIGTGLKSLGRPVFIPAKKVISTASVWFTNMMIANEKLRLEIDHLTPGHGAMYIFFGMKKSVGDLPKRNWWCFNTKEYDYDKTVDDFLALETSEYLAGKSPLMFVSFPSAKDPEYKERNPSKGPTGVIISVANWKWFEELAPDHEKRWGVSDKKLREKRTEEYKAIKGRIGRKMVEEAAEFMLADGVDFYDHVDYIEVGTPLTNKHYLNVPEGSIYSADHDLSRYLPENLIKSRPETPIRGLTQGGQDILSCGISTTVTTGLLAAGHATGRKLLIEAEGLRRTKNTVGL